VCGDQSGDQRANLVVTKLRGLIGFEDLGLALLFLRQFRPPTLAIELRRLVALLDLLLDQRVAVLLGQRLAVQLVRLVGARDLFVVEGAERDAQGIQALLVTRALGVFDVGAQAVFQRRGGLGVCHSVRILKWVLVIARRACSMARKYAHARYHIAWSIELDEETLWRLFSHDGDICAARASRFEVK